MELEKKLDLKMYCNILKYSHHNTTHLTATHTFVI